MTPEQFSNEVLCWFDQHGRHDLPWQQNKTGYHTWVSEIMLQQTQVTTVIPYYQRFMERFPTVEALAEAPIDEVLHLWTGLGYYARARNLHKAAERVVSDFHGIFPTTASELETLPGIGRSTAGAVASIAGGERAAILDGNVKRVLTRFLGIRRWSGETAVQKQLWQVAESYTPQQRCGDYTQAMMDLGATLCTRSKPSCLICPLNSHCIAKREDLTRSIPASKPKKTKPEKSCYMLLVRDEANQILLIQRPPTGLWGGLWCLPEVSDLRDCESSFGWSVDQHKLQLLTPFRHSFSHYHLDITPVLVDRNTPTISVMEGSPHLWYNLSQPQNIGLPAPVARLIEQLPAR